MSRFCPAAILSCIFHIIKIHYYVTQIRLYSKGKDQWFPTRGSRPTRGASVSFQGGLKLTSLFKTRQKYSIKISQSHIFFTLIHLLISSFFFEEPGFLVSWKTRIYEVG